MVTTTTTTWETFSAMRKILLAALAALTLAGCHKTVSEPVKAMILTSEEPSTRTGWNGETIEWTAGDAISMAYSVNGSFVGPNLYPSDALTENSLTAAFRVPGNFPTDLVGAHHFYAVYPAVEGTDFSDAPDVFTAVPEIQTPTATSFDPAADLMAATSTGDWRSLPASPIPMIWTRLTAHGDITLKNLALDADETVQSIVLQGQNGAELTGDVIIDLCNTEEFAPAGVPRVTVLADNLSVDASGNLRFWVSIFPVELTELTVTLTTDKATYRKVFRNISKTFKRNARNILGISMQGAEKTPFAPVGEYYVKVTQAQTDWTGDYLIVYEANKLVLDGDGTKTTHATVSIADNKIAYEANKAYNVRIEKDGTGYSMKMGDNYYGLNSSSNALHVSTSEPTDNYRWTFQTTNGVTRAYNVKYPTRFLQFNAGSMQFRCYTSAQKDVTFFKLDGEAPGGGSGVPAVTTEKATAVTQTEATLNASYAKVSSSVAPQNVGFYVGTSTSDMLFVGNIAVSGESGAYSVPLTELTPNQKYYYYATMSVWNPETNQYMTIVGETLSFSTKPSGISTSDLDWAELPALNYTHITVGGDYYIDNNHYSLYQDGSLYVAHHWTNVASGNGHYRRNYTTCWSSEYKCPLWVTAPLHSSYNGNAKRSDNYKADPDIPSSVQYSASSSGNTAYTRGHMLASNQRLLQQSVNNQVFFYTNIAPQASFMNGQGTGWNNLEDYIMGEKGSGGFNCADTLYVVIGNYFETYTDGNGLKATKKRDTFMGSSVQIPTMLYVAALRTKKGNLGKSVKDCMADELQCAAFCRSQNSGNNNRQVSANDMITVAELEQLTGFTFFANVPNAPKTIAKASDWGL